MLLLSAFSTKNKEYLSTLFSSNKCTIYLEKTSSNGNNYMLKVSEVQEAACTNKKWREHACDRSFAKYSEPILLAKCP